MDFATLPLGNITIFPSGIPPPPFCIKFTKSMQKSGVGGKQSELGVQVVGMVAYSGAPEESRRNQAAEISSLTVDI